MHTINPPQIMGRSPGIVKLFEIISRIAPQDLTVLISGEKGTYKELVARIIHENSPRRNGPFIALRPVETVRGIREKTSAGSDAIEDAAAFGHLSEKIAEANGGTLFIEEISDLNAGFRNALIPIARDKLIRLSDYDSIQSDVRIIGATRGEPGKKSKAGETPANLVKLFCGVHIRIPSLRERREDILPLAAYFMDEAARKFNIGQKELSEDAKKYLIQCEWPGDACGLENMIIKAAILSQGALLEKKDLLMTDMGSFPMRDFLDVKLRRYMQKIVKLETCNLYDTVLSEVERSLIDIILQETGGNQLKTARILGINRNTLRSKIRKYKIRT